MYDGFNRVLGCIQINLLAARYIRLDFLVNLAEGAELTSFWIEFESIYILAIYTGDGVPFLLLNTISPRSVAFKVIFG